MRLVFRCDPPYYKFLAPCFVVFCFLFSLLNWDFFLFFWRTIFVILQIFHSFRLNNHKINAVFFRWKLSVTEPAFDKRKKLNASYFYNLSNSPHLEGFQLTSLQSKTVEEKLVVCLRISKVKKKLKVLIRQLPQLTR